tara:strand:+ start:483 stop:911 length:429 start_codon:yes stop_codon:yes gene_type:complete
MPKVKNKVRIGVEAPGTWLTPIRFLELQTKPYSSSWYLFRCRCGNEKKLRYNTVYNAKGKHKTRSCGCKLMKHLSKIGFKKGNKPHHAGKKNGEGWTGRNGGGWNKGKIRIDHSDGTWSWIDIIAELPPDTGGLTLPGEKQR